MEVSPSPAVVVRTWFLVGLQSKAEIWVSPPTAAACPGTALQRQKPPALHSRFAACGTPLIKRCLCNTRGLIVCLLFQTCEQETNVIAFV